MQENNNFWKLGNKIGLFFATLFVVCFAWYYINPIMQELHVDLLELSFIGYSGMNFSSFIAGLIQSYIWGYVGLGLWKLVENFTG